MAKNGGGQRIAGEDASRVWKATLDALAAQSSMHDGICNVQAHPFPSSQAGEQANFEARPPKPNQTSE